MLLPPPSPTASRPNYDYRSWLRRRVQRGNWFGFFREFIPALTTDEALVVGHLANVGQQQGGDGFVPATSRFIESGTGLTPEEQTAALVSLRRKGIAEIIKRGQPPIRHVRVDLTKLEAVIREC